MAKYLLSYDEQDVKNGNLDVSPDGVLKSAGKSEDSEEFVVTFSIGSVDWIRAIKGGTQGESISVIGHSMNNITCDKSAQEIYDAFVANKKVKGVLLAGNGSYATLFLHLDFCVSATSSFSVIYNEGNSSVGASDHIAIISIWRSQDITAKAFVLFGSLAST